MSTKHEQSLHFFCSFPDLLKKKKIIGHNKKRKNKIRSKKRKRGEKEGKKEEKKERKKKKRNE